MIAFLSKPTESAGFENIIDFLNAHPIKYALTVNPTIYTSCVKQFWGTAKVKNINREAQLHAKVDGKKVVISKASIRRDLWFRDEGGIDCLPNETIFEKLLLLGYEKLAQKLTFYKAFFCLQWKLFIHTILQCLNAKTFVVICLATDQKFNFSKYIFDSMVKNLDSATKFLMFPRFVQVFLNNQLEEMANHTRIYVPPSHTKKIFGNIKRAGKCFFGRDTPLFPTMTVQAKKELDEAVNEEMYDSLERVTTTATSLDAEQDIGNINEDIFSVNDQDDTSMFDVDKDLQGEEVVVEKAVADKEPKANGIVMQEPSETPTPIPIVSSQQPLKVLDKGKGIMVEEPLKMKKKDQIFFDKKVARKLQEEIYEQEILVGERARQEEEANKRLHAKEQEQFIDAEKAKLFMKFMEKRRKFFVAKRDEERRKKPPTKAQQRSIMTTYLKNMDGWKPRALKNKSFTGIKDLFDKAMTRINNFVDFKTKLRIEDENKSAELKRCLEIVPDDGDYVIIDTTPLSSKSPTIVDYKVYKEERKNFSKSSE
nr:hypothetical protein [Tanacetum cinerariifolium]